jgi:hypothetical protein
VELSEFEFERVRPKMMTVVAIMAGLIPILWSTGTGSEAAQESIPHDANRSHSDLRRRLPNLFVEFHDVAS